MGGVVALVSTGSGSDRVTPRPHDIQRLPSWIGGVDSAMPFIAEDGVVDLVGTGSGSDRVTRQPHDPRRQLFRPVPVKPPRHRHA